MNAKEIIDSKVKFAYMSIEAGGEFGHINIYVRNALGEAVYSPDGEFKIKSQIDARTVGRSDDRAAYLYGEELRYHVGYDLKLKEMEEATKMMRIAMRKMDNERAEHGDTHSFADYACRALRALKVDYLLLPATHYVEARNRSCGLTGYTVISRTQFRSFIERMESGICREYTKELMAA